MLVKNTKRKRKDTGEGYLIKDFIYNDTFNGFHSYFSTCFFVFILHNSKQLLKWIHTRNYEIKTLISQS